MGCLAWLLAMAGIGGASLAFAMSAPGQAWWVLGLIVIALVTGPHLLQWWLNRARRTERLATGWWAANPTPIEVAFLSGGPDRVTDLVIADMVADGRLAVDDDGRIMPGLPDLDDGPGSADAGFRQQILSRLAHGTTDVATLRFSTRAADAMPELWRAAVRQRLVLPAWRRAYTPWYLAGAIVAVGYCLAVALDGLGRDVIFGGALAATGLGVLAVWRVKFLIGYEYDPRTAAGLRAAELARVAEVVGAAEVARAAGRADNRRLRTAVHGIRSASDLRPGVPDPRRLPASQWHIPWYARRVHEENAAWWHEVAQATTNYAEPLGKPDGGHDPGSDSKS